MLRKIILCLSTTFLFSSTTNANEEIWVLIGASHFVQHQYLRPSGQVWLYRSQSSCRAGLLDVLSYRGDDTRRTLDQDNKEQVNVDSDDGYKATYVCVRKRIRD